MSSYFLNCNFNESSEIIVSVCTIQGISGKVQSSLGGRENRYKILWYLFRESQRTPSVSIMWCDSSGTEHHLKSEPSQLLQKTWQVSSNMPKLHHYSFVCSWKYWNEDNFSYYALLPFMCYISGTQPGQFCPPEDIGNIWRHFWLSQLRVVRRAATSI